MTLPPGVLETGVLKIDWTSFSLIRSCYRKAWHALAHRRRLSGHSAPLVFNGAIHAALDVRQRALMAGDAVSVAAMEAALERSYLAIELPDDEWRTLGRAKEVIGKYVKRWPGEEFEILASEQVAEKELGVVEWEQTISDGAWTRTRNCRVIWQGRTDGIWRDRRNGRVTVKDTKGTSKVYDWDKERLKFWMSPQLRLYCWLFSGREWGEILDGIIDVVVAREPLVRPTAKSLPREEFERLPLSFTPELIAETRRDVLREIGLWLTACGHYQEPPPMTGAPDECTWTKSGCSYLSVCRQRDEASRMSWLMGGNYEENTWNPMTTEEET